VARIVLINDHGQRGQIRWCAVLGNRQLRVFSFQKPYPQFQSQYVSHEYPTNPKKARWRASPIGLRWPRARVRAVRQEQCASLAPVEAFVFHFKRETNALMYEDRSLDSSWLFLLLSSPRLAGLLIGPLRGPATSDQRPTTLSATRELEAPCAPTGFT
jgi:hypothetical protein